MTNTIFFNLDDASYSTSSPDSILSQQQGQEPEGSSVAIVQPSSSYSTRLNNLEDVINGTGKDQILLSNSLIQHPMLKNFSFKQLKKATKNFHSDSILGQGGFGIVFKGWIDENTLSATKPGKGTAVAVKRLNYKNRWQGHEEWLAEIKYLGNLHHLNLVRLLGYCLDKQELLLVYEFMPRGSLDNHLFRNSNCQLSWSLRLKIALETAKAAAFLHSAEINVIHRGLTLSNILLDSNYNAKLSDFGLARDGPTGDMTHLSTRVMGTYGYAAPEYVATGHLTAKSDVFGFGVVLLEILSGRRVFDTNRTSAQNLVEWAKPYLNNKSKIFHVIDNRLEGQYSLRNAQKAAKLALQCTDVNAKLRPNMDVVVATLEQLQDSTANK